MKRSWLLLALPALVLAVGVGTKAAPAGADAPTAPTFAKDVAPILYNNCVTCHREGEVAPMSLISYEDARPWARAIRDKVVSREMPPWGADPQYGKFKYDRALSQKDIDTITAWANGGALKGDDKDMPALPKFASGWQHGEPDAILENIEVTLPAEGEIPVEHFYVKSPFKEDVFIKALEVRVNQAVVHHAGVFTIDAIPEGTKLVNAKFIDADGNEVDARGVGRANGRQAFQENNKLLSYVPGRGYEEYQAGAGQRIKANGYIDFYMHYQASGKIEKDKTKIGLYFAKAGQEVTHQIYHGLPATQYIVEGKELTRSQRGRDASDEGDSNLPPIPPYVDNFKVVSIHPITEPTTIHGLTPHLHLRGKSMKYTATYPDGKEEVLLYVPKYDFNWQMYYEFETPKTLPVGSKITVTTLFDNSLKNKYNPAPHLEVFWSEQSWDEMYAPQMRITYDNRDLRKMSTAQQQQ